MGVSRNSRLQIGLLTKRTHQNHQMKDLKTVRFFVQAPRSASKGQHTLVLYKKQATSSVSPVVSGARTAGCSHPVEVCMHGPLLDPELSSKGGTLW